MAGQATAPSAADRTASASAQARSWKPGRRRQPSGARERWKPEGGETRAARLDAQHDSATGRVSWPETPRPESAFGYLSTYSMAGSGVPTERAWSNTLPGIFTIKRQAMSAPQSDSPKQICENILVEGKRYNIEHRILPSENAIADRLLARGIELTEAYDELHGKLHAHPRALQNFLGLVLSTAAFWNPEKIAVARAARGDLGNVNQ